MIRVLRITDPNCLGCFGASFGDCDDCDTKVDEIVMCKDCEFNRIAIEQQGKTLCSRLHIWVEETDFCAWGRRDD